MAHNATPAGGQPVRHPGVAYLVSQYPTLSHAFIEREVAAVRTAGMTVRTWSVRPTTSSDRRSRTARLEGAATSVLLGRSVSDYLRSHGRILAESPRAWSRGLATALRNGPPGTRQRLWQLFYLTEAAVMMAECRAAGIRHVHVHFANNGADVARLVVALGRALEGPAAGWRWTFSMHGPTEFTDVVGHDLAAKVRSAAAIACISEYCRRELLAVLPAGEAEYESAKTSIVRMSVDAERYTPTAQPRFERAGSALRVLFVGRLVEEKDPLLLCDVVRLLRERGVPVHVRIVGEGPLRARLEERAGQDDGIEVMGGIGQDDLPDQYAWADVFCLPSYAEGVPAVLMEAMATELPVVTTRIAGIPELVEDGVHGRLVAPGDPSAVADALQELATDPARRQQWGRAGRVRVVAEFSPALNAQRLLQLWWPHDRDAVAQLSPEPDVEETLA